MKKAWFMKLFAVGLGVSLVLSLVAGCVPAPQPTPTPTEEREVIRLRLAAAHGYAPATWVQIFNDYFAEELERRALEQTTDYKIETEIFLGGTLLKVGEVFEGVESGIADIGLPVLVFELSKLALQNFTFWLPFGSPDPLIVLEATRRVDEDFPILHEMLEEEYNQKLISWVMIDNYQVLTNFPAHTLEDFKGHKIAHGGSMVPWVNGLGGVGVQSAIPEAVTSIQTGVYDGYFPWVDGAVGYKIYEVAQYYTQADFGAVTCVLITMNLDKFNSLPEEIQDIIIEVGHDHEVVNCEYQLEKREEGLEIMREAGVDIYVLPEAERQRWAEALEEAGIAKHAVEEVEAMGLPGKDVLQSYIKHLMELGYTPPVVPTLD